MNAIILDGHTVEFTAAVTGRYVMDRTSPDGIDTRPIPHVEGYCQGCGLPVCAIPEGQRRQAISAGFIYLRPEVEMEMRGHESVLVVFMSAGALATLVGVEDGPPSAE